MVDDSNEYILYSVYQELLERCLRAEKELRDLEVEWRTFAQRPTYSEGYNDGYSDGYNEGMNSSWGRD